MHRLENVVSSSHYDQLVNTVYTDQPIELWLGLWYEDPNTQVQATPEHVVMAQIRPINFIHYPILDYSPQKCDIIII